MLLKEINEQKDNINVLSKNLTTKKSNLNLKELDAINEIISSVSRIKLSGFNGYRTMRYFLRNKRKTLELKNEISKPELDKFVAEYLNYTDNLMQDDSLEIVSALNEIKLDVQKINNKINTKNYSSFLELSSLLDPVILKACEVDIVFLEENLGYNFIKKQKGLKDVVNSMHEIVTLKKNEVSAKLENQINKPSKQLSLAIGAEVNLLNKIDVNILDSKNLMQQSKLGH